MSERFEVPAGMAFILRHGDAATRDVDVRGEVERIVKAEVERALTAMYQVVDAEGNCCYRVAVHADAKKYLAVRFEAAPEPVVHCVTGCGYRGPEKNRCAGCLERDDRRPTPSAPAVRIDGVLLDTNLRNTCVRCAWMPDGSLAGRCERCGQAEAVDRDREENPRYTPAERDFVRALAEERKVGAEGPRGLLYSPTWEAARIKADEAVVAAARRVTQEVK